MKRTTSRASKTLTENQNNKEIPPSGITDEKWKDFLEKEDTNMFLLGIREEIIQNCMKICYDNYLKRQSVSFAVHCAYLAWIKVIGVYYMFKDPGDADDCEAKSSWEPDEEPEPSEIDSWASQCIKSVKPQPVKKEKEVITENVSSGKKMAESETESPCSLICDEGGEFFYPNSFSDSQASTLKKEKSIFSKTLSMSKESLMLLEPLAVNDCKTYSTSKKDKKECKTKVKRK